MVNNSSNINKTNNHLSPQIINPKKTTTYEVGNPGPFLGQTQKYLDLRRKQKKTVQSEE
jgi:hypothetical protein